MMKKILHTIAYTALTAALVLGTNGVTPAQAAAATWNDPAVTAPDPSGTARGYGPGGSGQGGPGNGGAVLLPPAVASPLDPGESAALLYMVEEEKLARDVYTALSQVWSTPVFDRILQSEQQHMDALLALIERYELADPTSPQAGVFTNPDLQALYNELVAQGSRSLAEALEAGARIEELDISDLSARIAQTDNADIQQVYTQLQAASGNHLQAFTSVLSQGPGAGSTPHTFPAQQYQQPLAGAGGRGSGGRRP